MSQAEVFEFLQKQKEPISSREIANKLNDNHIKVCKDLNKMLKYNEVECIEIDRFEAKEKYNQNIKRRLRLFSIKRGFIFMAVVDLATGKIFGCKEGSKVWWHEKGHIAFSETEWGAKISYYQIFFQMIAVFAISLGLVINWMPLKVFGFINALGMVLSYAYEETWAWVWGLKQYNKNKTLDSN